MKFRIQSTAGLASLAQNELPLGSIWMADVGAVGLPRGSNQSTVARLGAWYLPMESFLLAWSCIADPGEVI